MQRYDIRELEQPRLAEQLDLVPEPEQSVTARASCPARRRSSLVIHSAVFAWFPTKPSEASTVDGTTLTMAHELPGPAAAVSSLTPSLRTRLVAAGYSDASLRVFHVTSDRCLIEIPNDGEQPVRLAAFTPRGCVVGFEGARRGSGRCRWAFPRFRSPPCFAPCGTKGTMPREVWQSSGGGDDFEPKLGMMPLVFGTLKATIYSLLFAVPCALVGDLQQRILAPARESAHQAGDRNDGQLAERRAGLRRGIGDRSLCREGFSGGPGRHRDRALYVLARSLSVAALAGPRHAYAGAMAICVYLRHVACGRICLGLDRSLGQMRPVQRRPAIMARRSGRQRRRGLGRAFASRVGIVHRAANRAPRQSLVAQLAARRGTGTTRGIIELVKFLAAVLLAVAGATAMGLLLDSLHLDPRGMLLGTYMHATPWSWAS